MTSRISASAHAALLKLFDLPITVAEYSQQSNIIPVTSRKDVERYLAQGLIFAAGKVRLPRGPPASRYCNDARKAMLANLAWQASEQEAVKGTRTKVPPLTAMLEAQSAPEHFPAAMTFVDNLLGFARATAQQTFGDAFTPDHVIAIYDRFLARHAVEVKAAQSDEVAFEDLK